MASFVNHQSQLRVPPTPLHAAARRDRGTETRPECRERGGLAGAGRADDHVPGKRVEGVSRRGATAELRGLERVDALRGSRGRAPGSPRAVRASRERLLLRLLRDRLLEGARGSGSADPSIDHDADEHQHDEDRDDHRRPGREQLRVQLGARRLQDEPHRPDQGDEQGAQDPEPHARGLLRPGNSRCLRAVGRHVGETMITPPAEDAKFPSAAGPKDEDAAPRLNAGSPTWRRVCR
jgi:hypothetical protein